MAVAASARGLCPVAVSRGAGPAPGAPNRTTTLRMTSGPSSTRACESRPISRHGNWILRSGVN